MSTPASPSGDPVRLALTLGDPRGIGPEVMSRAVLAHLAKAAGDEPVVLRVLGDEEGLETLRAARHPAVELEVVEGFDGTEAGAGALSVSALRRGVELAFEGAVEGIVTGPVAKPALHAAGARFPGQTEFLQALAAAHAEARDGAPSVGPVGMLMASERSRLGGPLRILLATTHLPLREVPDALTSEHLEAQLRLLHRSLQRGWGIPEPRIALCALNPHASDGGLFGDEEARVLEPLAARLREEGIRVDGPFPADTVFLRALSGDADAVAAPYHDVGMAVFKTLAFGAGVNVTLGLPFVRTSPDHGTAFDLAGQGKADPASALEALRLAARLARNLRPGTPS
jgi:4-hydroxythreonine-4-phosphate dehydrogenase